VLRELLMRDPALREVSVSSGGLEEAFLALTSESNGKLQ
jgi:hypothetical protein